jgi:integrase
MKLPARLSAVVCARELRYTLRTADTMKAKYRALKLALFAKGFFKAVGRNGLCMADLTKEAIDRIMREELEKALEEMEEARVTAPRMLSRETLEDEDESLSYLESDAREALATKDYRSVYPFVDALLEERGIDGIDKGSETHRRLCRELLKVRAGLCAIEQKRIRGDYSDELRKPSIEGTGQSEGGMLLSQAISDYVDEHRTRNDWTKKTEQDVVHSLALFKEVLGDIPVGEINKATVLDYIKVLKKLPPNRQKQAAYRRKSVKELLCMRIDKTLSDTTINGHLARASALCAWAVESEYMSRNPAKGVQLTPEKRDDEYTATFSMEDLQKLFRSKAYLEDKHRDGYCFWVPIIALYTGARLNEICQLHLDDIYEVEDGTFVIDINNRGDKQLKNKASRRIVPLHDFLVRDLNLPGYVKKLDREGKTRLFPNLKKHRDGYGHTASKWFGRYKKRCGVSTGSGEGKKVFHSFRHTVINTLKQINVMETRIGELVGHSSGSIDLTRYGKRYPAKPQKEQVVALLKYNVDLSHLKQSKYAGTPSVSE